MAFTSYCRATTDTDAPGINDAATISRLSASGQRLRGRAVAVVPIISFVDTSRPHDAKHLITLGEWQRFGKAVPAGGIRSFDDFWLPFLGGATSTSTFAATTNQETGGALAKELRNMIPKMRPDGSFVLPARAWAVAGIAGH